MYKHYPCTCKLVTHNNIISFLNSTIMVASKNKPFSTNLAYSRSQEIPNLQMHSKMKQHVCNYEEQEQ